MSPIDVLRVVVLKTNPYWPFSRCNRWPYALAVRALRRSFRKCPEIRALWIWHDRWIPGLSDIDVTVLIRRGLTAEEGYAFLVSFWRRFDRLRRVFPMIEAKLIEEEELPLWLRYANSGHPGQTPVFLRGNAELRHLSPGREFALAYALWVHMDLLPPCHAISNSFLRRHDIERRVRKILRLLETGAAPEIPDGILAMEAAVGSLDAGPADRDGEQWADHCECEPCGLPLPACIRAVLRGGSGQVLAIVEDGLDREQLRFLVDLAQRYWGQEADQTAVLPERVFSFLLRRINPYLYTELRSSRILLSGDDPLPGIAPPSREAFAAATLGRVSHVLTFLRGEHLFSRPLDLAEMASALDRAMAVILLLRDRWVSVRRRELGKHWKQEFPDCSEVWEQVQREAAEGRAELARKSFFLLFYRLVRDIVALSPPENSVGEPRTPDWVPGNPLPGSAEARP
jgi:hypothetical protein